MLGSLNVTLLIDLAASFRVWAEAVIQSYTIGEIYMIVWQGWGILAFLYIGLGIGLVGTAGENLLPDGSQPMSFGLGLALAAAACWFTGIALNHTFPERKFKTWLEARHAQLTYLVDTDQFSLGPGELQPTSKAQAAEMAEELLKQEIAQAKGVFNRHRLFWIPIQYIGILAGVGALVLIIMGAVNMLG